jgi:16S rRNA (uracil1498-N3)-methyltransferase
MGTEYTAKLDRIRDERVDATIVASRPSPSEPSVKITLYMAYPKGDKLETVVQKAVELGVSRIVPFESSRCIKRPSADKAEANRKRLSRIALEAAKQCGRGIVPEVALPLSFREAVAEAKLTDLPLFCYEDEGGTNIKAVLEGAQAVSSISVMVGSEGGFSPDEASAARESGMISVGLGPRILRCETAPDYALSVISYRFEL